MCRLFETIRIENGIPQHLSWHERRMDQAIKEFWPGSIPVKLSGLIHVPPEYFAGTIRCNIHYGPEITDIIFKAYEKRMIRSLKLVIYDTIDYHWKFKDRSQLELLFARRGVCDDILIVKNGLISDTSMSNIIFYDGLNRITPATPLLKGSCRDRLLEEGWLKEADIRPKDLPKFSGCKLVNAMRYPDEEALIPISGVRW